MSNTTIVYNNYSADHNGNRKTRGGGYKVAAAEEVCEASSV